MMIYDGPSEYKTFDLPFENFQKGDILHIGVIDIDGSTTTRLIKIDSIFAEYNPFYGQNNTNRFLSPQANVSLGIIAYKNIFHRFIGKKSLVFKDKYTVPTHFLKQTKFDAEITFLSTMYPSQIQPQIDSFNKTHSDFLTTYLQHYKGLKTNAFHTIQTFLNTQYDLVQKQFMTENNSLMAPLP